MTDQASRIIRDSRLLSLLGLFITVLCIAAGAYGDIALIKGALVLAASFAMFGIVAGIWSYRSTNR